MSSCDNCKQDFSFWDLTWNGRYISPPPANVRRKMTVCPDCLEKHGFLTDTQAQQIMDTLKDKTASAFTRAWRKLCH